MKLNLLVSTCILLSCFASYETLASTGVTRVNSREFCDFCSAGDLYKVDYAIQQGYDPSAHKGKGFIDAAMNGHLEVVKYLCDLTDTSGRKVVNPLSNDNMALRLAARGGHFDVVKFLLGRAKADPAAQSNEAIIEAASHGHLQIVQLLAKFPEVDPSDRHDDAIIGAAAGGHLAVVQFLAGHPKVNPANQDNQAIINAAYGGHKDIVEFLKGLRSPKGKLIVDPSDQDNQAIINAAENGHLEIVRSLLKDLCVDASAQDNRAIVKAAAGGHLEIVKLLAGVKNLSGRMIVDASARENSAIIKAAKNGHLEVVRFLSTLPKVDPAAQHNAAVIAAAGNGHAYVVDLLCELTSASGDIIVDPSDQNNLALVSAAKGGYTNIVYSLSSKPKVRITPEAFIGAVEGDHLDVVLHILRREGVNPGVQNNQALRSACKLHNPKILEALLRCEEVTFDPSFNIEHPYSGVGILNPPLPMALRTVAKGNYHAISNMDFSQLTVPQFQILLVQSRSDPKMHQCLIDRLIKTSPLFIFS